MAPPAPFVDWPAAYIAGDRRRALAAGEELPERVHGAVLFADISGFTPLTEALVAAHGPQRGAEELSAVLDGFFDELLVHLHRHGGSVVYFSGDAITCWLDGDDGRGAVSCAVAMQAVMPTAGSITLPSGSTVQLALKVAVAVGPARRFVVGDPEIQLIDVLAGALMDAVAAAERRASPSEVLLHPWAVAAVERIADLQLDDDGYAVVRTLRQPVTPSAEAPPEAVLPDEVVRPWLLPAVWERIRAGRGEFLAELRAAVPLFLRFGGLDFDQDPDAPATLNTFVVAAQQVVDGYGGSVLQLTLGDKGAYLYAVFGAPLAHEDDEARACAAALELRALGAVAAVDGLRLGMARGRLRSGTYGHATRRTFCCLGDAVNTAARLMAAADDDEILVTEEVRSAAGAGFAWGAVTELPLKGKSRPVRAHPLRAVDRGDSSHRHRRHTLPMIGREAELAVLERHLVQALDGHGQVVVVRGSAGLGKSRLLVELGALLTERGVPSYEGEAQAFGVRSSYGAWQGIWRSLTGITEVGSAAAAVQRWLTRVLPDAVPRGPLLGTALGLPIPDNELTDDLDPKLRKASLEALLVEVVVAVTAGGTPLALMIEDGQWLDPLSVDLLHAIGRSVADQPVLVVIASREDDQHDVLGSLRGLPHVHELELPELTAAACREVVATKLSQLSGPAEEPPDALLATVLARGQGNPFYLEELVNFVHAQGIDPADPVALAAVELPDSLHSLVLSRVDTLAEGPRRTAKVASVIGRSFPVAMLRGIYPELGGDDEVLGHLQALQHQDLVVHDRTGPEIEATMVFRHVITAQAAYESTPARLREVLHGHTGAYVEQRADPELLTAAELDQLAFHYGRSSDLDKKREYLVRAGDQARGDYANAAAVDHYRRVEALLELTDRVEVLVKLGGVLALIGSWTEAEATDRAALDLVGESDDRTAGGRVRVALAEVCRKQGRYDEATEWLVAARREFESSDHRAGVGEVLHLGGTLAAQQGRLDEARRSYQESLAIRRELDDAAGMAALFSNLAVVAEYDGDLAEAQRLNEQALQLRQRVGDRWAIGVSQNNLGMTALLRHDPAAAVPHFEEAMRLNREVGDLWMVAIAHNNLGNAHRELGDLDAARRHLGAALAGYGRQDDPWALAIVYEDIAVLAARRAADELALQLVGAADRLRDELGSPRPEAQQETLHAALAGSRTALGPAADAAEATGRSWLPGEAAAAAARACS